MLEWKPDDGGRKNRSKLWRSLTGSDPNMWWGPRTFTPTNPDDVVSGIERWARSPSPIRKPSWYDDDLVGETRKKAKRDPTGIKRIAQKAYEGTIYITPEQYEDDVDAMIFYGSFGLLDPTNVTDAALLSSWSGMGYGKSFATVAIGGFLFWGILGWTVDPADVREGGLAEKDWYQWITDPSYWFGPGKWY